MPRRRVSVGGLMGVVLVASLGLAALRSNSPTWAGATFLATCGALTTAVVGAVCRGGSRRAWWLGFALFGWGYLALAFLESFDGLNLPTATLLGALRPRVHGNPLCGNGASSVVAAYPQVGHCLFGLLAGAIGGVSAFALFGARRPEMTEPDEAARRGSRWSRPAIVGVLFLLATVAAAGIRRDPAAGAAGAYVLAWGLLLITVVGAVSRRGRARAAWLGAALFGIGYMGLIFHRPAAPLTPRVAADRLLDAVRGLLPANSPAAPTPGIVSAAANDRILAALARPLAMSFPYETPLVEVLKYIRSNTQDPGLGLPQGIPIYVDPVGLQEAETTLQAPITMDLDGLPIRVTLRLALEQRGLAYQVQDGLLTITCLGCSGGAPPPFEDPFLVVGHCLLALVAAGLGGLLGPLVCRREERPAAGP